MKKILTLLFLSAILQVSAQANIVKLNVLGLAYGNFGVQYERTLGAHSSVAMSVAFLPSRHLPGFVVDDNSTSELKSLTFSGWSFTPEYRYYFSGNAPKGFYAAPYFRYSNFPINQYVLSFTSSTTGLTREVITSGSYKATSIGLMLGSQWLLGENLTLDWWIIGAGIGSQKADAAGLGSFSATDIQDIKNELADLAEDAPGDFTYTVSSNSVYIKYEPSFPAIRGFGLCLGYKF